MTDDDELIAEIASALDMQGTYYKDLGAERQEELAQFRACARKAGQRMREAGGKHRIRTGQRDLEKMPGRVLVYAVDENHEPDPDGQRKMIEMFGFE